MQTVYTYITKSLPVLKSCQEGRSSRTGSSILVGLRSDTKITHTIFLTDSKNLQHTMDFEIGCSDWHVAVHCCKDHCVSTALVMPELKGIDR